MYPGFLLKRKFPLQFNLVYESLISWIPDKTVEYGLVLGILTAASLANKANSIADK